MKYLCVYEVFLYLKMIVYRERLDYVVCICIFGVYL